MPSALGLGAVLPKRAQRRLAQEQIGLVGKPGERLAWAAVSRVGKDPIRLLARPLGGDPEAPGAHVVLHLLRLQSQVTHFDRPLPVVLHEDEALVEEVGIARSEGQLGELTHRPRRHDHREAMLGHVDPRIAVAQRDEVQAVVGVHVADHYRVELIGRVAPQELRHDPRTDVHQDARAAPFEHVTRTGFSGIGAGRAAAEDGQAHVRVVMPERGAACLSEMRLGRGRAPSAARSARSRARSCRYRPGAAGRPWSSGRRSSPSSARSNRGCGRWRTWR